MRKLIAVITAVVILVACPVLTFAETEATETKQTSTETVEVKSLPKVKGFKATSTYKAVELKWQKVKGADGYTIKWKSGKKSGKYTIKGGSKTKYTAKVPDKLLNKKIKYSIRAYNKKGAVSGKAATCKGDAVRTMQITFTLNTTRTLVSHDKSKTSHTFKKGTKITAYGYDWGRYIFDYKGKPYFVKRISTSGATITQLNLDRVYTKKEAEDFVNKRGVTSNTNNLVWVNTYTQRIYIFKGSKGKWKFVNGNWKVSTGLANTPTPTGLARMKQKVYYDKDRGLYYWSVCSQFSIHGKASHYPAIGSPASNGCVRNETVNAKWIYNNTGLGTSVFVF